MIPRNHGETQRAYVERVLRGEGVIATRDALYGVDYDDGRRCSITRLAAIIHGLRGEGWDIASHVRAGELATYRLHALPGAAAARPPGPPTAAPDWHCVVCGAPAVFDVRPALGGMGQSRCDACHGVRYFRRAA